MNEQTTITVYEEKLASSPELAILVTADLILTLDQGIEAWVNKNYLKSQSTKTKDSYEKTLQAFRVYLRERGFDLDSDRKIVADCAEKWANLSKREGKTVSVATYRQRLFILSSFYEFARKREVLDSHNQPIQYNPIDRLDKDRKGERKAARPIEAANLKTLLAQIDRSTPEGLRDYALLQIALHTGHRAGELVGLRMGHLHFTGASGCFVEWVRCKGNKEMGSNLGPKVTQALQIYLTAIYGPNYRDQPKEMPVWVSFSDRNNGQAIGYQTIRDICKDALKTGKVHTTRHSAVVIMMDAGATMEELRQFTGHNDVKELATYIEKLKTYQNPYGTELEDALCLD